VQGVAEQLVQPGFPGPVLWEVQDLAVCGVRGPGRSADQPVAQGGGAGAGVGAAAEGAGGAGEGEVVGDRRANEPGGVRGEPT